MACQHTGALICESCSALDPDAVFGTLLAQDRVGEALDYASDLAARAQDPGKCAAVLLRLGVLCEKAQLFDAAAKVAMSPAKRLIRK